MVRWRLAKSLNKLRDQINKAYPRRNKASDGTIGDAAHQNEGNASDHNPWIKNNGWGVVTAFDATHDPEHGADMHKLTTAIVKSRDKRIKYIIWDRKIVVPPNWKWQIHSGDPHLSHAHFSVKSTGNYYDDTKDWAIKAKRTRVQVLTDALKKSRAKTAYYKKWSGFWKAQAKRLRKAYDKLKKEGGK